MSVEADRQSVKRLNKQQEVSAKKANDLRAKEKRKRDEAVRANADADKATRPGPARTKRAVAKRAEAVAAKYAEDAAKYDKKAADCAKKAADLNLRIAKAEAAASTQTVRSKRAALQAAQKARRKRGA
jgi:hypothetical protein